ncbi:MAG: gliding motility-associated C-terminal domain-containing protein [Arcicella sp.]|nr:gliding motility-associated C-terminal domain-containing protein [Arcicella sp.]
MNKTIYLKFCLVFLLIVGLDWSIWAKETPLFFTENKGQWERDIKFVAHIPGGVLQIREHKLHYIFWDNEALYELKHSPQKEKKEQSLRVHGLDVVFENSNSNFIISTDKIVAHRQNYFMGNDPKNWVNNVSSFSEITLKNLYDGIDLRLYTTENSLKYEFIVAPRTSTEQIKMRYEGADEILLENGNLRVKTSLSEIIEMKPYTFSETITNAGSRQGFSEVKSNFRINKNTVSFSFPEGYDHSKTLTIDPKLIFSTFSGSTADNWGHTATYDSQGNLYAGGSSLSNSGTFPATVGVFQLRNSGFWDVAILKFSADGSKLLYATHLGGVNADIPHSLIVNSKGELLIFGTTSSPNFPTTTNAYDQSYNGGLEVTPTTFQKFDIGSDIFVAKFSNDGSRLLSSTYIGGSGNDGLNLLTLNYGDEFRGEIVTDEQDNVYIASVTDSQNFPIVGGSNMLRSGVSDAVVCQLNPDLSKIVWSGFIGGNDYDAAFSLKVSKTGNIYVCGATTSNNLPFTQTLQTRANGNMDAFVMKLSRENSLNSKPTAFSGTYLGTTNFDFAQLMDIDQNENVYVYGLTFGTYPILNAAYSNPRSGQFIHSLDKTLSKTNFSTTIGTGKGSPDIVPTAFLVNECGNIYLSGWGGKVNDNIANAPLVNTKGMPVTADAFRSNTDGNNFYIALLEKDSKSLLYATFFGGDNGSELSAGDHVDGGTCRFDKQGFIYHSACACNRRGAPSSFTTTPNAWSRTNPSSNCNNAAFKFDIDNLRVSFDALDGVKKSASSSSDTLVGCMPFKVKFTKAGIYTVTLKGTNLLSCKREETVRKIIKVLPTNFKVIPETVGACEGKTAQLLAEGGVTYAWSPATGLNATNIPNPIATITKSNFYNVEITNQFGCKETKTVQVKLEEAPAKVTNDTAVCRNKTIQLFVSGGTKYTWKGNLPLSDSTAVRPSVTITKPATFTVNVLDEKTGCKAQRTVNIGIDETFKPDFSYVLSEDCGKPTFVKLQNNTKNATRYVWLTGQGDSLTTQNPEIFSYNEAGIYTITLKSYKGDCLMIESKQVEVEKPATPPNVITPNGDGKNDFFVVGVKLESLEIQNRWGQAMLKTTDYKNDWGKDIPVGTYYYYLKTAKGAECKGWIEVL